MASITVIKLTSEKHKDVDEVCSSIKAICDNAGVAMRGPIPLPTRRIVVPCRKSPDGEGCETYDHWEIRIHKRLLEVKLATNKDEGALRQIARIAIPDSVSIELAMRSVV